MSEKERKLTLAEQKRKDNFKKICQEMEREGYTREDLTVGVVQANVMAVIIMLPFAVAAFVLYRIANPSFWEDFSPSYSDGIALFVGIILLVVVHEAIHGLTWGVFAKGHGSSIAFGFIWKSLTPYCTCAEPLTKWQYVIGAAMPTLVLGFGLEIIAVVAGNYWLHVLSLIMMFSGGGDFFIILKMLNFKHKSKDVLYCDHPYECGVVAFVKK